MQRWGMSTATVQIDPQHQTGQVQVQVIDDEPRYEITPDCAYDFIETGTFPALAEQGILYHGTLGLRNDVSRDAFIELANNPGLSTFLDVNLRAPWWQKDDVYHWLQQARWVKLNQDELRLLGFTENDTQQAMSALLSRFQLEQVILTQGGEGASVLTSQDDFHNVVPAKLTHFVDTVGAGDAFSAIYIHGLLAGWSIPDSLKVAQQFASGIIGLRGATPGDPGFYQAFVNN
jgi:fructokinase